MGFIYKIEVEGELYIGSTKHKLYIRQREHNYDLNIRNSNSYIYRFCREKKVKKIICELIEEVYDNERILLEQEYITMLEPSLNINRAFQTEKEKLEQIRLKNKKHNKINNKIKSNCHICGLEMLKTNINKHIKNNH
jgi:hypothetical protein|tara:strand:- start:71 stop:481 length:411 start_codon:yes stop_codon:yes gene_type:complete